MTLAWPWSWPPIMGTGHDSLVCLGGNILIVTTINHNQNIYYFDPFNSHLKIMAWLWPWGWPLSLSEILILFRSLKIWRKNWYYLPCLLLLQKYFIKKLNFFSEFFERFIVYHVLERIINQHFIIIAVLKKIVRIFSRTKSYIFL